MEVEVSALKRLQSYSDRPEPWHDLRYARTLEYLDKNTVHQQVLDVGGYSTFTKLMFDQWPDSYIENTGEIDIRQGLPYNKRTGVYFDTIVMTEVIEHVYDIPSDDIEERAMWTGSGQEAALQNVTSLLCRGGRLFISTPNVCGFKTLWRLIHNEPPRTFDLHVRELTKSQLANLVIETGLKIVEIGEWVVWHHHGLDAKAIAYCEKIIGMERGDILYCLAAKV